ncbi:hypothetical protein [Candidatus Nitrososphaera sp. FF02]|uniref:hypothetical protein n=1 Tax=Candidatus Nitrososphaera sp. FF02 TaxID=3398226 RepID=UPI0039EB69AC
MNKGELCAAVMALHENVMGAFYVRDGRLAQWRMKEGLALPAPEKVAALMFQRTLIHGLLKEREEYVGSLQFNLSSYDQMDLLHFGMKDDEDKMAIMLVTIVRPYDLDDLVAKVVRLLGKNTAHRV